MSNDYYLWTGSGALTLEGLAHFLHDLFPTITAIGAICGTVLAIHGVYQLIKGWWKGRKGLNHPPWGLD